MFVTIEIVEIEGYQEDLEKLKKELAAAEGLLQKEKEKEKGKYSQTLYNAIISSEYRA